MPRGPYRPTQATAAELHRIHGSAGIAVSALGAAGADYARIRAAVSAGSVSHVKRGLVTVDADPVVVRAADCVTRLRCRGVDAVIGGETAAQLHGIPLVGSQHAAAPVTVFVPPGTAIRCGLRYGLLTRATAVPNGQRTVIAGLPATSLLRTAVDVAGGLSLPYALVPLDAAAHEWVLSETDSDPTSAWWSERARIAAPQMRLRARALLDEVVASIGSRPGSVGVRRAARLTDPRADNPLESLSRGHLLTAGLPAPELQVEIKTAGRRYFADFGWPGRRVIGEADGRLKYVEPGALYAEKRREDDLRRVGWTVVRWTWDDVVREPSTVVARVAHALRSAA